jgi:antitoxin CcdA
VDMAKELGINLSQTVDALLNEEVKRRYWEKWRDDNREAMLEYNERIAREGLPLAKYRTFGKSLGDGTSATSKSK